MTQILGLVTWLSISFWIPGMGAEPELVTQVKELGEDIVIINLLNGLNLKPSQERELLTVAEQAVELRRDIGRLSAEASETLREARRSFAALRAEILKGAPVNSQASGQAQRIKQRLKRLRRRMERQTGTGMKILTSRVESILTEGQIYLVDKFRPCLIPPDDLDNPASIGQADASLGIIERMRRMREMPDWVWDFRKTAIVDNITMRIEEQARLTDEERQAEKRRLAGLLQRIRDLSDIDFEADKLSLARQLKPRSRIEELHREILWRMPHGRYAVSKIERFLLSERIIPILRERLE